MRELRIPASAGLAGLLILFASACGGGSQPTTGGDDRGCVNAGSPHHAFLVVEHLSGRVRTACVGFTGSQISGDQLMKQSGIAYQAQHFSFGDAVCAVDREPASFDQCLPQNAPYWALWTEASGGSWQQAQVGFTAVELKDGDALGWRYTPADAASPPPPSPPGKFV